MPQDIHLLGARHCYACIQWDGKRSFDQVAKTIRADIGSDGRCLVKHTNVKGTHRCELFFPLR
jgi:hypothetical protein